MQFANPEAFLLLLLLPLALAGRYWQRPKSVQFSSLKATAALPRGWSRWGPALLAALRVLALALLVTALARPQTSHVHVPTHAEGIAIQLVIDNSYSMRARDYELGSQTVSRLDAVKHAVRLFVQGGEHGLPGRPNDRIGLITFARDPNVACPATLDHDALLEAIDGIALAPPVGTNIGDALAWALDRLHQDPTRQKVIILLSDGSHNVKEGLPPLEAARLAADLKIKVYTIGAVGNRANPQAQSLVALVLAAQGQRLPGDSVDEPTLQQIANWTGGQYYRATDTAGLLQIYEEIDRLETTRLQGTPVVARRECYLAFALPAALLLALELFLAATRLLRVP